MPLSNRILNVTFELPNGDVILDASINMKVRIYKAALAIQNRCTIDVMNLTGTMRESLLSQFTAFNQRKVATGQASQNWINMTVEAGYDSPDPDSTSEPSIIFKGQVVTCEITSPPPNMGVRITCYTRQIDKTTWVTTPSPDQCTFEEYVTWAAGEMGFGSSFICDTSYNDVIINNPARSILVASALLIDIQDMYKPDVAAFVDDDFLIVKDRNKILNPSSIAEITQLIGAPSWTEWGIQCRVLFDQSIQLAQGIDVTSLMNPSINGQYVVMELDYELSTRDVPFYVNVSASPPAD